MNPHVPSPQGPTAPLEVLGRRVRDARIAVGEQRQGPAGSVEVLKARESLLDALDDYITALEAHRVPVPYLLRDELRLHRQLFHH